ncbi:MAG: DUF1553 domain-containing protein, partial [Verrucomicrobiales bacterium]|nr:DUF1553 domain-containing protein [Verrucomicrobiales bacterium]
DAVLTVSGQLDPRMFGPAIPTHRTEFMTGRGGRSSGPLDGDGRRSIYGAVYRNFLSPFMLTFDQPNPFGPKGRRSVSNVPAQSLALMNDPFIVGQAKFWAEKSESIDFKSPEERIRQMYEEAFGSLPDSKTVTALHNFLETQGSLYGKVGEEAWADLAHVLINMKEFVYLR